MTCRSKWLQIFVVCVILIILFHDSSSQNVSNNKWIGTILKETLPNFSPPVASTACLKDSLLYKAHLENGTTWAIKMLDSSANSISGVLIGNTHHFGNFDQCLSINVQDLRITGKYCLIKLRYWPTNDVYPHFYDNNITVYEEPDPISSVWRMLQVTNDPRFQRRDIVYIGVCLPSSCSSQDLQYSLQNANYNISLEKGIRIEFNTSEDYCTTESDTNQHVTDGMLSQSTVSRQYEHGQKNTEFGRLYYIIMAIIWIPGLFIVLFIAVSISTGVHVYNEAIDKLTDQWYYPFSALHNIRLMKKPVANEYAPACGLKVLSMFIVIYGHRHLLSLYTPMINMNQNEKRFGNFFETYILNGSIVVDTFFCTSGFITYHKMLSGLSSKKQAPLTFYLFFRWIRITTVFILTVFFMVYVLPLVGSGPLWEHESYKISKICLKYWWVNPLYIGNYLHADKLCLIPAWYLACDMQLFILSVTLIYAYMKNKLCGKVLLFAILCVAIVFPGVIIFTRNFYGIFRFYIRYLETYYVNEEYLNVYSSTFSRSSPYLVGMVSAFFHIKMKKNNLIIPFWLHVILAFSTIFITSACILSAWPFYLPQHKYNSIENALYAVLSKVFWGANMCWIIMANSVGGENLLSSKILSSKVFIILSRLTLSVLLVHTPLQFTLIMSMRTPQYLTHFTNIWMAMADIFFSYSLSFILYLLVEAPVSGFFIQNLLK